MKIRRALFEMESIVNNSWFKPEETFELFAKIPFTSSYEVEKTELVHGNAKVTETVSNEEKMENDKKIQKKRKAPVRKRTLGSLSRQRRAANDRERRRNVRLNQAFVTLKKTLPLANIDISKIEILRLAVKWIDHLATLLKDHEQQKEYLKLNPLDENGFQIEKSKPVRHDCLYHQDPDLKNTLWEDCIGLPSRLQQVKEKRLIYLV